MTGDYEDGDRPPDEGNGDARLDFYSKVVADASQLEGEALREFHEILDVSVDWANSVLEGNRLLRRLGGGGCGTCMRSSAIKVQVAEFVLGLAEAWRR